MSLSIYNLIDFISTSNEETIFTLQKALTERFSNIQSKILQEDVEEIVSNPPIDTANLVINEDEDVLDSWENWENSSVKFYADLKQKIDLESEETPIPIVEKNVESLDNKSTTRKRKSKKRSRDDWVTVRKNQLKSQNKKKRKVKTIQIKTLIVKGLPYQTSKDDLFEMFESHGSIEYINVLRKEDNQCIGIAFVKFLDSGDAKRALTLNNINYQNRYLRVELANPNHKK